MNKLGYLGPLFRGMFQFARKHKAYLAAGGRSRATTHPGALVVLATLVLLLFLPRTAAGATDAAPSLGGVVVDRAGGGLEGATVQLFSWQSAWEWGLMAFAGRPYPTPVAEGRSAPDGSFQLEVPETGIWGVAVLAPGRVPVQAGPVVVTGPRVLPPVSPPPDVGCTVLVRHRDGRPAAGAAVFVTGLSERPWEELGKGWNERRRLGFTDPEGRVLLPRAPEEPLRLRVVDGVAETTRDSEGCGTLKLSAVSARRRALRVMGDGGAALAGVQVRLGRSPIPAMVTDEEGRGEVEIPAAGGGATALRLLTPDGRRHVIELPPFPTGTAAPTGTDAPAQAFVVIPMPPSPPVHGRVVDGASRQAVAGALVWPVLDPGSWVRADDRGNFSLPEPERRSAIQAAAPGWLPAGAPWNAGTSRIVLALPRASEAAGQVVAPDGTAVTGALVAAAPESDSNRPWFSPRSSGQTLTSSLTGGAFHLPGLLPKEVYALEAAHPAFAPGSLRVQPLEARERREGLVVRLTPTRHVFGIVADPEATPLAEAAVWFHPAGTRAPRSLSWKREETRTPDAVTAADGTFEVRHLPTGTFHVEVARRGFADLLVRGVAVPPAEEPIDLGTFTLEPAVTLSGRVLQEDEVAVPGAAVFLFPAGTRHPRHAPSAESDEPPDAVTGPDGRFEVGDLKRGRRLDLFVDARGFLPERVPGLQVPLEEPLTVHLRPGARLAGVVVDEAGVPIPGAELELQSANPDSPFEDGRFRFSGGPSVSAVSDEEGRFVFADVVPGEAQMDAGARGFQAVIVEGLELRAGEPVDDLEVVLPRGARVEGTVRTESDEPVADARLSIGSASAVSDGEGGFVAEGVPPGEQQVLVDHRDYTRKMLDFIVEEGTNELEIVLPDGHAVFGVVRDTSGRPVSGARVAIFPREPIRTHTAVSDEDGRFHIHPVPDGTYDAEVEAPGFPPTDLRDLLRVEGAEVEDVEIVVDRGGRVRGFVRGLELDEIAEVRVIAHNDLGRQMQGTVSHDGEVAIENLPLGDWRVEADLGRGSRQTRAWVRLTPERREAEVELTFGRFLELSGRVHWNGEPLAWAHVSLISRQRESRRGTFTDHRGEFVLSDVPPGNYQLQVAERRTSLLHAQELELTSSGWVDVALSAGHVAGRVVSAVDGSPLPQAMVILRRTDGTAPSGGAFSLALPTESGGTFRFPRVTPGGYRLEVHLEGYVVHKQSLEVDSSGLDGVEVALEPSPGLELVVGTAAGDAPPYVALGLLGAGGELAQATMRPVEAGRARFPNVPAGRWEMLVRAPGFATTRLPVLVPGPPISLQLHRAHPLQVRVPALMESGEGASLQLLGTDGRPFQSLGDLGVLQSHWPVEGGRARVEGLPPGAWTAVVTSETGRVWRAPVVTTGAILGELVLE